MNQAARLAWVAALVVSSASGVAWGGPQKAPTAKEQVDFGVKMASRGLWSEALFRFQQASRLDPSNADILNNLAVAHEALGMFDEALEYYRKALELDPSNRGIRGNYSRFVEFYQSFKPAEKTDSPETSEEAQQPPTPEGHSEGGGSEESGGTGDRT